MASFEIKYILATVTSSLQIRFGSLQVLIRLRDTTYLNFPKVGSPQIWILSMVKWIIDSGNVLSRGFCPPCIAEAHSPWINKFRCSSVTRQLQTQWHEGRCWYCLVVERIILQRGGQKILSKLFPANFL